MKRQINLDLFRHFHSFVLAIIIVALSLSCEKEHTASPEEQAQHNADTETHLIKWGQTVNGRWVPYLLNKAKREHPHLNAKGITNVFASYMQILNNANRAFRPKAISEMEINLDENPLALSNLYTANYSVINGKLGEIGVMDSLWNQYSNMVQYESTNRGKGFPLNKIASIDPVVVNACALPDILREYFSVDQLSRLPTLDDMTVSEMMEMLNGTCVQSALAQIGIALGQLHSLQNPAPGDCTMYRDQINMAVDQWLNCPQDPPHNAGGGGGGHNPGTGGGGSTPPEDPYPPVSPSIPENASLPGQDGSGIDVDDYIDCFSSISNSGASYNVTVYVQEPEPGTDQHFGSNGVGHAAIGLTKTGSNGQSITQVLGFYPVGSNIFKEYTGPAKIVDNGINDPQKIMKYTIKMDFDLEGDGTRFNSMLTKLQNPSNTYHALLDNCVKYVVEAAIWGGLDLPFEMSDVVTIGMPGPTPGVATVSAYTPAGMAQEMRMRKSEGDSRIKTANNAPVATSKGPC